jgi:GNAT superfamily N-acetyltransferase
VARHFTRPSGVTATGGDPPLERGHWLSRRSAFPAWSASVATVQYRPVAPSEPGRDTRLGDLAKGSDVATSGVTIRPARDGDGTQLVAVWDDARDYYATIDSDEFLRPDPGAPVDPERFVASLVESEGDPGRLARVAVWDGQLVGFIVARVDQPVTNAAEQLQRDLGRVRGYVEALGVHRAAWRHGIGRALMHETEQWARSKGAEVMKTDTSLSSPVSPPFYEALGYQRQAVILRKRFGHDSSGSTGR